MVSLTRTSGHSGQWTDGTVSLVSGQKPFWSVDSKNGLAGQLIRRMKQW